MVEVPWLGCLTAQLVLSTEHCVVVELDVEQVLDVIPETTIHALALVGDVFFC